MQIKTYIAGPFDANNYLVIDEKSKEAMLVDCSAYVQDIVDFVKTNGLKVKYILITHGHFDHVLGINKMRKALGAEVYVPQEDIILIENINEASSHFGGELAEIPVHDHVYSPDTKITLGDEEFIIIKTPGHTEGGVCIKGHDVLFSGDTLFKGTFGRTDLFGGNIKKLVNSLTNVLFYLPDEMVVYPGHNEKTTIGYEKKFNDIFNYIK